MPINNFYVLLDWVVCTEGMYLLCLLIIAGSELITVSNVMENLRGRLKGVTWGWGSSAGPYGVDPRGGHLPILYTWSLIFGRKSWDEISSVWNSLCSFFLFLIFSFFRTKSHYEILSYWNQDICLVLWFCGF